MKVFLEDCYEILRSGNGRGLPPWSLLSDYLFQVRVARMMKRHRIRIFDFSVKVLSPEMGMGLFREIFVDQVYYFSCDKKNPLIVDCGSNVGMSVAYFKKLFPKCRIVAAEPDPNTFRVLTENIAGNHWADVTPHNKAITRQEGVLPFYINETNPGDLGMSVIPQDHLPTKLLVPSVRLSSLIGSEHVDFLKLDIEGAEPEVIDELASSGALLQIDQMVIECHHHIAGSAEKMSHILGALENAGYGYQVKCPDSNFGLQGGFQVIWIYAYKRKLN